MANPPSGVRLVSRETQGIYCLLKGNLEMTQIKVESFLNHKPGEEDIKRMQALRTDVIRAYQTAEAIVPESAEKTLGVRKLEEALMWFNKSIVLNPFDGKSDVDLIPLEGLEPIPA